MMTYQQEKCGGFILAGGESSRMGRNKALLEAGGVPLILHMKNLLSGHVAGVTVIGPPGPFAALGLTVAPDDEPGAGPLGGIATALRISTEPWCLVVGCDMPFLSGAWLAHIVTRATASPADVVLPESATGLEPMCGVYRRRSHRFVREALSRGVRKVTDGLAALSVEIIRREETKAFDSDGWLFKNVNTPEEYAEARARLGKGGAG